MMKKFKLLWIEDEYNPFNQVKRQLEDYIEYTLIDNFSEALATIEKSGNADIYLIDCRLKVKPEVWDEDLFGKFNWDNFQDKFIPKRFF